ncbi:actin-like ATPase domain-containing protein [Linderina pennispora]|uniref:Xylulose kinase n=1 Tax=Linderina pennispora TaxID=61395 RepID=A0A1Y1W3W0_9FUNG|nr:actin-like ATPase domain-containing protein [Linderina pennispora]ORX68005.1 actin-like ATPase domain-containing protein [Linderina pennispora]
MTTSSDPLFLGLDLSTQQLKGILVTSAGDIIHEATIPFDTAFPTYATTNGRHIRNDTATTPVLLWVEAIDRLFSELCSSGYASRICGISGAAQQHGSVYWTQQGVESLARLDSKAALKEQLQNAFAVMDSPIWEDSSTAVQCKGLEQAAGSAANLARISGSVAFERFTGAQIAKIKQTDPDRWSQVAHISLVSSFAASLIIGKLAPIDASDASGTNLYDIGQMAWSEHLCNSVDQGLSAKLGPHPVMADAQIGTLAEYFRAKYGMPPCPVVAFTGDNPSAFAGFESLLSGARSSAMVISLGTSDTVLSSLDTYPYGAGKPTSASFTDGHVLQHPTDPDRYMAMLCYKNGSLAREHIRNSISAGGSWQQFNDMAAEPADARQILPKTKGTYRFVRSDSGDLVSPQSSNRFAVTAETSADARMILESQAMSMRLDFRRKSRQLPSTIVVTGGASQNPVLRQIIADVFGTPVYTLGIIDNGTFTAKSPAMPAYGGAIRAMPRHADNAKYAVMPVCHPDKERCEVYEKAMVDFEFLRNVAANWK